MFRGAVVGLVLAACTPVVTEFDGTAAASGISRFDDCACDARLLDPIDCQGQRVLTSVCLVDSNCEVTSFGNRRRDVDYFHEGGVDVAVRWEFGMPVQRVEINAGDEPGTEGIGLWVLPEQNGFGDAFSPLFNRSATARYSLDSRVLLVIPDEPPGRDDWVRSRASFAELVPGACDGSGYSASWGLPE